VDFFAVRQSSIETLVDRIKNAVYPRLAAVKIDNVDYWSLPIEKFDKFCEVLNLNREAYELVPSSYNGISILKSKKTPARPPATGRPAPTPTAKPYVAPPIPKPVARADPSEVLRKQYVELCKGRGGGQIVRLETQVREQEARIVAIQQQLVGAVRELNAASEALTLAQQKANTMGVFFEQEFDKMVDHPDIEKIEVVNGALKIYTGRITITHDSKVYDIGKFKIELYVDGRNGCVSMRNLTHRVDSADHPHVMHEKPCLGNIREALPELIAQWQFPAAVSLCIQFLKSYTASDGGRPYINIERWPLFKE
jgi:hypothetical protein